MILIHGDCGSGKSAALRSLEATPPAGFRAVYVPVPTLDFPGLARWCLDRLGLEAAPDPVASLRAAAKLQQLLLLIDDAERLPLDAALAARQLERDSDGAVAVVAACASDAVGHPAIVALAAISRAIVLAPGKSEEAAAAVRDRLAPGSAPRVAAPVLRREPAPAQRVLRAAIAGASSARAESLRAEPRAELPRAFVPPHPAAPPPSASAPGASPPRLPAGASTRTVPLSLAVAVAVAAFAIPVAFIAGYFLGGTRGESPAIATIAAEAPELPPVASAPPDALAKAPEPARELALRAPARPVIPARTEPEANGLDEANAKPALAARVSPPPPAQAAAQALPPTAAVAQEPRVAAAGTLPVRRRARRSEAPAEASVAADWGAPAMISVESADARR